MSSIDIHKLLTPEDLIIGPPIVINLSKDKDRWEDIVEHFAQWGIAPERFEAVSGVKLPAMRSRMKEYSASLNLSHAAVSRHCYLNTKKQFWLVLEDDCRFLEDPRKIVYEALKTITPQNPDWSIISLGCTWYSTNSPNRPPLKDGVVFYEQPFDWFPLTTHALLINRVHAVDIIGKWSACMNPVDWLLLDEYKIKRAYLRRPSAAYQEEYPSYFVDKKTLVPTKKHADLPPDVIEKINQTSPTFKREVSPIENRMSLNLGLALKNLKKARQENAVHKNNNLIIDFDKLLTPEDTIVGPPLVLNLAKDKDRWEDIIEHFAQWGIVPERFDAMSGVALPDLPRRMTNNYFASLNLSHAAMSRRRYLYTENKFWLILEDDCRFLEDPRKIIFETLKLAAKDQLDWSILSLGCYSFNKDVYDGKVVPSDKPALQGDEISLVKPEGWFALGSHSYLVNRIHAKRVIGQMSTCLDPADRVLIEEYAKNERGYLRRPSATYQEEYLSHSTQDQKMYWQTKRTADLHPHVIEKICEIRPQERKTTEIAPTGYWSSTDPTLDKEHHNCRPLAQWLIDYLSEDKETPIYDFGCGFGFYLNELKKAGFQNVTGFEGDPPVNKLFNNIKTQDLTKPFSVPQKGTCIFLEVAEHVPAQYEDALLDNVIKACDKKIIMSWAVRGQHGKGHVNCLNNDEAIAKFEKLGFRYCEEDSLAARQIDLSIAPWFKNTIMIFEKIEKPEYTNNWFDGVVGNFIVQTENFSGRKVKGLEIGSYEGRASNWLVENWCNHQESSLTCIDPFTSNGILVHDETFKNELRKRFVKNTTVNAKKIRLIQNMSNVALQSLIDSGEKFDFIYIDGDHHRDSVAFDAEMCHELLSPGGVLSFDDYKWETYRPSEERPEHAIDAFLEKYKDQYEILIKNYQVHVRKKQDSSKSIKNNEDPNKKLKIVVYTITKNEEKFIERYCMSAKDADEIIIVDTGSTDATVEIAKRCGATVHQIHVSPWRFDVARSASLALVPGDTDICVALDADEVLEPGWRKVVEKAWKPGTTRLKYLFDYGNDLKFMSDKLHGRHGYMWKHPCHECLETDCRVTQNMVEIPEMLIRHLPDPTKSRSQYLDLLEVGVKENSADHRHSLYYARELTFVDRHEEAIQQFMNYLALPTATWADERAYAMRFTAKSFDVLGNPSESLKWYIKSTQEAPHRRESWFSLAQFCYEKNMWERGFEAAVKCFTTPPSAQWPVDDRVNGFLPYDYAAIAAHNLGKKKEAVEYGKKALALAPDDLRLKRNLDFYLE